MNRRHLEIFIQVADCLSMNQAAKKMHISQPGVSQAIRELEEVYHVKLFERLSQKIYLTKDGELLLSFARHIIDSFEKMEDAMLEASRNSILRIGCSVSVGTCMINDILDEAKQKMKHCKIYITVENTSQIEKAILNNEVDLGIVEGMLQSMDLNSKAICKDELVVVCGKHHPLAMHQKVNLEMLSGMDYISRESGSTDRNQLEKILEEANIHLQRIFCSTNTEAIKNAVMRNQGIAILSKRMIEKELNDESMHIISLDMKPVTRDLKFVVHKNKFMSKDMKQIQEIICNKYKNI